MTVTETRELLCGDTVKLIGDPNRPLMTVWNSEKIGGEEAYECKWLDESTQSVVRTWHRRNELKAI